MKFFSNKYNDVYYICTWLNNKIKRLHIDYFMNIINEKIFIFFKKFFNQNKHDDNKCIRICINNDSEYFEKTF